jgi:hypothetical protein
VQLKESLELVQSPDIAALTHTGEVEHPVAGSNRMFRADGACRALLGGLSLRLGQPIAGELTNP